MFGAFFDMTKSLGLGSGGNTVEFNEQESRKMASGDILQRLATRDSRFIGIKTEGIVYALVEEIALLRVEIEKLKQKQIEPKVEHVTGSSFVLKI